nr:MAG TPA: hypothetical protein [Bacteriophage sp.]
MHYKSHRGGGTTYSENEQRIGTWIDGKPVYRKVIKYVGGFATGQGTRIKHGIENLGLITHNEMICVSTRKIFPFVTQGVQTGISDYDDTTITVWSTGDSWDSRTWAFILEYTKTTDKSGGVIKYLKRLANTFKRGC